jgi:hypothetical protein
MWIPRRWNEKSYINEYYEGHGNNEKRHISSKVTPR